MKIEILEQDQARKSELLVAIAGEVFEDFDPAYIEDRLPHMVEPAEKLRSGRDKGDGGD